MITKPPRRKISASKSFLRDESRSLVISRIGSTKTTTSMKSSTTLDATDTQISCEPASRGSKHTPKGQIVNIKGRRRISREIVTDRVAWVSNFDNASCNCPDHAENDEGCRGVSEEWSEEYLAV